MITQTVSLNGKTLRALAEHRQPASASLLMPVMQEGQSRRENPIRLKSLVHQAEEQLEALGLNEGQIAERLSEVRPLVEDVDFWREARPGLAVFIDETTTRVLQLPGPVNELATVSDRFQVKSLMALQEDARFYILALSQNSVRLYRAGRFAIEDVDLPDTPESLADSARFDDLEKHVEFHTGTSGHGPGKERPAMVHGQGVAKDEAEKRKRETEYVTKVAHGVRKALREAAEPLMLVGADPMIGLYRQHNAYAGLLDEAIHGNPDQMDPRRLHELASERLGAMIAERIERDADRYRQAAGHDQANHDLPTVLTAAGEARIDTAFVALDDFRWGVYDPETRSAEVHADQQPGDQDLLSTAASLTYCTGGKVHAVDTEALPCDTPVAAVLRYKLNNGQ